MRRNHIVFFLTILCVMGWLLTDTQRVFATEVTDMNVGTDATIETDTTIEIDTTEEFDEIVEPVTTKVETYKDAMFKQSLKEYAPEFTMEEYKLGFSSKGKVKITWGNEYDDAEVPGRKLTYILEVADNAKFKKAKKFTTKKKSLKLDKSAFGKNGGTMYFRVRFYDSQTGKKLYSSWSEVKEYNFVKINKKNFPGMYELLQKGGACYDIQTNTDYTQVYDLNGDGWLDPKEIWDLDIIQNVAHTVFINGIATAQTDIHVSGLEGVKYLKKLSHISLSQYSGRKVDFSKNPDIEYVDIHGIESESITIISPTAREICLQSGDNNHSFANIDLSKCKNVQNISTKAKRSVKNLKLPNNKKNLRSISFTGYTWDIIDLNEYVNLQEIDIIACDLTQLRINKCQNLRYLYFYICEKIKWVDVRANGKLRIVDASYCDYLTASKIQTPGNTQVTEDRGMWFMHTEEYKKDNDLIRSIGKRFNIKGYKPWFEDAATTSGGKVKLNWTGSIPAMEDAKITYEVQMADNPSFKKAKKFTTTKNNLAIKKSRFGKNGGTYYFRVRLCDSSTGKKNYTGWSEPQEYTCVKINKTNFPGLYKLLKEGSKERDSNGNLKKVVYDTNKDGWLDPAEINEIGSIRAENDYIETKDDVEEIPGVAVSSLEGLEYLKVSSVRIDNYTGSVADVSGTNVSNLFLGGVNIESLKIIAPGVDGITVAVDGNNKKVSEIDFSECNMARNIAVFADNNVELLKLPKNKYRLACLQIIGLTLENSDFSMYKNLKLLETK